MTPSIVGAAFLVAAVSVVAAYASWLWTARERDPPPRRDGACRREDPEVLILVPVYDEAPLIERKLENLEALTWPAARRRVVVVDGGSTDGTLALAARWIGGRARYELLQTSHRNKTAQIRDVISSHRAAAWIIVTDADAMLPADTIERMMDAAAASARVAVVGVRVRPAAAHRLETMHWRATDWLRHREALRGSAGIVAAPCYLARREMLAEIPANTVADDVYVACRAMLGGYIVGHADATVTELRSPRTLSALLGHKYRKGDAYLREIFRFLPRAFRMRGAARAVFLWRAALLILVPLFAAAGAVASIAALVLEPIALSAFHAYAALAAGAGLVLVPPLRAVARSASLAVVLTMASAAALLAYPFSRQVASFPKVLRSHDYPRAEECE